MSLDLLASGYPSLDRIYRVRDLPRPGETGSITEFNDRVRPGGCGLNVAVGLARLGLSPGAACVLGDDEGGEQLKQHLEQEGVDLRAVRTLPDQRTSRSYLFVDRTGTVQNYFYPGAAETGEESRLPDALPETRRGLITVGPPEYNRSFLERLREREVPIAVQMRAHAEAYLPFLGSIVESAELLLMNEVELEFLTERLGCESEEELLSRCAAETIVVTRGKRGVRAWTKNGSLDVPAVKPRAVVDETGAGDGFCAGLMAGITWEWPLDRALRLGTFVSSFVLEEHGAQTGLPDRVSLRRRASQRGDEDLAGALNGQV